MKKLLSIFVIVLLTFVLVSCKDDTAKTNVKVTMGVFENNGTSITFELNVEDKDSEIEGDFRIVVKSEKDSTYNRELTRTKAELIGDEEEEDVKLTFSGLTVGTKYVVEVYTTLNEKSTKLLSYSFTSQLPDELEIRTVEDFFNIKNKRNAKYTLMNDLDFTGYEEEIKDNLISTFSGVFNGNNKTIKNYTLESSSINLGLFQQLSTNAEVFDLTIDNMTINHKGKATGSKRIGFLFGQNTTTTTKVNNITIKNSTINVDVNSESNFVEIGFLGGASVASVSNIVIEDTNVINVNQERLGLTKIGGLLGKIDNTATTDVELKNIITKGTINYAINQTADAGLKGQLSNDTPTINIGGLVGDAKNVKLDNAIVETVINFDESEFKIIDFNEKRTKNYFLNVNVTGLFATSTNVDLKNVLVDVTIDVKEIKLTNELDEEDQAAMKYEYILSLNVAGLLSNTSIYTNKINNVIRLNDNIVVAAQSDATLNYGLLFVRALNVSLNKETNKFGIMNLTDPADQIRVFNSLNELFAEGSWILENFN